MPSRVVTKRRSKIARLFFRTKRNNNTRRIVKHRRYDKIPKTKRPIYSGGGSLSVKSAGNVSEIRYYLDRVLHTENYTGRVKPAVTHNDAFSIELSRGTLSTVFGGNHTLKIEIDMSKYKHATKELVSQLFFEIFGVPIPRTFDFTDLVDLDHVLDNFDNLNKGAARNVGCYRMWNKLTIGPTDPKEDPTPLSKCVVTFEFIINAGGGTIEFNSISFTAIVLKNTKCLDVNNEIDVKLPGYGTITKKTPGTSITTSLRTSDDVSKKIGQLPTTFNVCVVPKTKDRDQKFYGCDDLTARAVVKTAVSKFKEYWDYIEE